VVDVANPEYEAQIEQVNQVLRQISADTIPSLIVANKIDLLANKITSKIDYNRQYQPIRVWVSAENDQGLDLIYQAIQKWLLGPVIHCCIRLKPYEGSLRSKLYELQVVQSEKFADNGDMYLEVKLQYTDYKRLLA